jgi:Na+-translocating ferredoxin:NAD+ oxidoreductase RNF subunit RnfB
MVEVAKFFMSFTQDESCGKCTPCREGTKRLLELLERLMEGHLPRDEVAGIKVLSEFVRDNALCGLGQNAPNPILSAMKYFEAEFYAYCEHMKPGEEDNTKIEFFITERCIGCTRCAQECPVKAIDGELKQRHVIDQKKCIKCGNCHDVCPTKAIDKKVKP